MIARTKQWLLTGGLANTLPDQVTGMKQLAERYPFIDIEYELQPDQLSAGS